MVLVTMIFLTSFGCFILSIISLVLIIKQYYLTGDKCRHLTCRDVIIITGCDSGIGLHLAKYFYRCCEFKVICCFLSRQSDGFKELQDLSNSSHNRRLILISLDITKDQDVQDLVGQVDKLRQEGLIDNIAALINNAGVMTFGEFDWLTWEQIQKQVDVNLVGTLRITRAMLPHIIESRGRVINVTSVAETTVYPGVSVYSATKSALVTFSKGLGYELRKFGAHVVTMRLGDFANLTNIMAKHSVDKADMWNSLESHKKQMYDTYFHQFHKHVVENRGMIGPSTFEDSSLFQDFRKAVLLQNPPTTIVSAPLSFRVILYFLELSPVWAQYYILDLFLQLFFKMKTPQVIKRTL